MANSPVRAPGKFCGIKYHGVRVSTERFLVTGALGCIGAWTVRRLVHEGVPVWTYDLPGEPRRLRLIMDEPALAQVHFVEGDIADQERFERAVADNGVTHIVHLAALQIPFVRADPVQGARVNVVGTAIVFETAKRHAQQVQGLAYASSIAVYGPPDQYPPSPLSDDAPLSPTTLYGVYKQANEGMARIYWQDHRVRSVGLRPYVLYGPGRDQGMTSTPTKAMLAAALGRPYHISYGGTSVFQYADDCAAAFIRAARMPVDGAPTFNLGGNTAHMQEIVAAIEEAAPQVAGRITFEPSQLPFPPTIDDSAVNAALGPLHWTSLIDAVRQTIQCFREGVRANKIDVEKALL